MQRKMTRFARGAKCGCFDASREFVLSSAALVDASPANASSPKPDDVTRKASRRDIDGNWLLQGRRFIFTSNDFGWLRVYRGQSIERNSAVHNNAWQ